MTGHECPACGRTFETRRGVGVHHYHAHGDHLPNRNCRNCAREFYCKHGKKYCSNECRDEATSFEGSNNPNYRDGPESTECLICGDEFEYYPSNKKGMYCSDCVETAAWRDPPALSGSENPRWRETVELECSVCGDPIERFPSEVTGEVAVCSEDCRSEWLSDSFPGSGHPNWKGGGTEAYGRGWNEVRRAALERDGHACVICSKSASELGRKPDVHHIVPVRAFAESDRHEVEDAHFPENVVSLCPSCHRRVMFGAIRKKRLRFLIGT